MADKKMKLIYFNLRARGEPMRQMFAYKGVEYVDERVEFADWPAIKADQPCGQLPVLVVDGKKLSQSGAIARYVGEQLGLTGEDAWQRGRWFIYCML